MKNFNAPQIKSEFIDKWGLIGKGLPGNLDGGDTMANEFTVLYCKFHQHTQLTDASEWAEIDYKLQILTDKATKRPIRHPDTTKWYGEADRCSRDQLIPLLCFLSLGLYCTKARFWQLFKLSSRRLWSFTWNTCRNHVYKQQEAHLALSTPDVPWNPAWKMPDFCGPFVWALWLRALAAHLKPSFTLKILLQPILHVLDLENLFATLLLLIVRNDDQRNHALSVHVSRHNNPTLVSLLTYWLYNVQKPQTTLRSWWTKPEEPNVHDFTALLGYK